MTIFELANLTYQTHCGRLHRKAFLVRVLADPVPFRHKRIFGRSFALRTFLEKSHNTTMTTMELPGSYTWALTEGQLRPEIALILAVKRIVGWLDLFRLVWG